MIFKRKKYPLPKFPETIELVFRKLCTKIGDSNFSDFKAEAHSKIEHYQELVQKGKINRKLAEQAINVTRNLLDSYSTMNDEHKALAIGGIRYFLTETDAVPVDEFASGLDDDVAVLNHVLEELGLEDLYIKV